LFFLRLVQEGFALLHARIAYRSPHRREYAQMEYERRNMLKKGVRLIFRRKGWLTPGTLGSLKNRQNPFFSSLPVFSMLPADSGSAPEKHAGTLKRAV
jgi:hypothetical protein